MVVDNQPNIVMLGASAGGLAAFSEFLEAMPIKSNCCFVLVSHLAPQHVSLLPNLLQNKTAMKVYQVQNKQKAVANCVYVLPPNKQMTINNGTLLLQDLALTNGLKQPVDTFLYSLAQDQGNKAAAIILSGTGSDGSQGIKSLHQTGGLVLAQHSDFAKFAAMPDNAVATGCVDDILAVAAMPKRLLAHFNQLTSFNAHSESTIEENILAILPTVCTLLQQASNHDFSDYKTTTICRRIERRMSVNHIKIAANYLKLLQNNNQEQLTLSRELLIGVTQFFRDNKAFEQLKEPHLLALLKNKHQDDPVRVWVAGCSTGEEVYTIAIIIQECMEQLNRHFKVQIFGTDIDENAINIARKGLYPKSIAENITPMRLNKFFINKKTGYQINSRIREMVLFATQNIILDPPFIKLDLLCCRNLLIYFTPKLQQKLFPIFHYSLKNNGLLFLGSSENLGSCAQLFSVEQKKYKIFSKLSKLKHKYPLFNTPNPKRNIAMPKKDLPTLKAPVENVESLKLLKAILSQSALPACAIIDEQEDIVYTHGRTGQFLELPEGPSNFNIINMAKHGLKMALKSAIGQVNELAETVTVNNLKVHDNKRRVHLNLIVKPLPDFQTNDGSLFIVIFEKITPTEQHDAATITGSVYQGNDDTAHLQEELLFIKESLQTNIEELETSNEEMKLTNEELQSTNEELQSTNEELETSKEEMQSLIEESASTAAELQARIDELMLANDDIKNLLDATDIASVFLDINCGVRRFTPKACDIFPLTSADLGRPISHFANKLIDINIEKIALEVLDDLIIKDIQVIDKESNTLRMRVRPYRTLKNVIDGVVITFEDITTTKALELKLQQNADNFEAHYALMNSAFMNAPYATIIQDLNGIILAVNEQAVIAYGWSKQELIGQHSSMLTPKNCLDEMAKLYLVCHTDAVRVKSRRLLKSGASIPVNLSLIKIEGTNGSMSAICSYSY